MTESKVTRTPGELRRREALSGLGANRQQPRRAARGSSVSNSSAAAAKRRPPALVWMGGVLAFLVLAIAVFLAVFQWNWLRGPIDSYASARLHRTVIIHGNLDAHIWSWTPSATAEKVTVAQPSWGPPGQMAVIPRLTISVDLRSLLHGRLILPLVDVESPRANLFRDAAGRNNWTFAPQAAAPQPLKLPAIRHLSIDDGRFNFADAIRRIWFNGVVSSNERIIGYGRGRFTLTGLGVINRTPFEARVLGGTLLAVDPDRPYPFIADIRAGPTHVLADGDIKRPFDLGVAQARTHLVGPDLADLYFLTGVALPNTPPYDISSVIVRNGAHYDISGIRGRIGSSDLAGHLVLRELGRRKDLTGELASGHLKLADLTAVVGGAPRTLIKGAIASPAQKLEAAKLSAEHRILPDAKLDVARIRLMDADVRYRADSVDAGALPVRHVVVHAKLDHGLLTLDPFALVLPQGAVSGRIAVNARDAPPKVAVDVAMRQVDLQELVSGTKGAGQIEGDLEGRAQIQSTGASVREAAAHANGVVAVAIPSGQMRQLFAELLGIDVSKSLFLYLSKDNKPTPVRCAVAEFRAQDGVLQAQRILVDTGAVQATGKGVIDLRNETLDLALSGKPKHFRLIRLAAPITLRGRLDSPKLGVDVGKSAAQLGVSAILGAAVFPLAAILPFISTGTKDADCHALLQQVAIDGALVGQR